VKRRFRLTKTTDFQRVRRLGKSYAHPLIVLIVLANEKPVTQWGVVAGKSVGGAVQRNRCKRWLREASRLLVEEVQDGWDLILIARQPLVNADFGQVQSVLLQLLRRAGVMRDRNDQ
jgi:ribonuclease P protein component